VSGTGSRHIASEGPETKADSYSFRRAYEAGAFQQLSLLRDRDFIKQAKERGVRLSVEVLEELDEIGALRPVAFATEHVVMSLLPRTDLVFRDETAFLPWENHAIEQGFGSSKPEAFYSHWHLLYTHDAVEHGIARVGTDWLLDDERGRPVHESFRGWYGHQDELRRNLDDDWRRTVLVLARLQNRYFPHIRGTLTKLTTTSVYDPDVGEFVDAYSRTVGEFDMKEMGIGLAAAVLIDATIVRAVLLPATMKLLGDWNWYLPTWLEWLPKLEHERAAEAPAAPVLEPTA
jgi:hypothetical protein